MRRMSGYTVFCFLAPVFFIFSCEFRVPPRSIVLMGMMMTENENELELLGRAAKDDPDLLGPLLARHHDRLARMVKYRLDRRLQGRIDAADVIQEAFLEASQRLPKYLANPEVPFFIWLRFLVGQKLALLHRRHLGVQARDAGRDISLYRGPLPEASSAALAAHLVGNLTSPSQAAIKAETRIRLQEALNSMNQIDREVLILRHFEHLTNQETAKSLDIQPSTATNRYVRALEKLRHILTNMPGGIWEIRP